MPLNNIQNLMELAPVFVLVLFRVGGLMFFAPFLGLMVIPVRIRILIALIFSLAVFPLVPRTVIVHNSLLSLSLAVGGEMLIGIAMGFMLMLMFTGIEMGAAMVSHQMGWAMARLVDPMSMNQSNLLSQFYLLMITLFYVLMNGHLLLIRSLAQTFKTIPLLGSANTQALLDTLVSVLTEAFKLGIRVAGPALVAIFLATLALGFISRTMPQLNILAAGFPVRIGLALVLLIASVGMVGMLFKDYLVMTFRQIGYVFL